MNAHVRDELNYLKNTVTSSVPARALDTAYQNGTSIRFVTATIRMQSSAGSGCQLTGYAGSNSTPSTSGIGEASILNNCSTGTSTLYSPMNLVVPASYWYKIVTEASGTATSLITWNESDLH